METAAERAVRVVVVDDSAVIRRLLAETIGAEPDLEIVGVANNGALALSVIRQSAPDVVVLDVEMPVLDGISTLGPLREEFPSLPVVMFSTLTTRGGVATIEALMRGATDCVAKPQGCDREGALRTLREGLVPKLRGLGRARPASVVGTPPPRVRRTPRASNRPPAAIVVAVSTGGPRALDEVVPKLPKLPVPTFVVQHMPPIFTRLLAERLDARSPSRVTEAFDGEVAAPGNIYVAPGGFHLVLERDGTSVRTRITSDPPENSCRPAADPLFRSAAAAYAGSVLAVVMTGMGSDGCAGSQVVCDAGGVVLAQDETTSVVWGMPGAVVRAGLADATLPLAELAPAIAVRARGVAPMPAVRT